MTETSESGAFELSPLPAEGTYTVLAMKDGYMTNWNSDFSARQDHALVVLPVNQLVSADDEEYTATILLTWGKMSGRSSDYDAFIGTAADLDLWVQFEIAQTGEVCLLNYAAPTCGDAKLVLSDALCCIDTKLAGHALPTEQEYGVETVQLSNVFNVSYTAWIGNFLNDQAVHTSNAAITVFVRDQRLTQIVVPRPCTYTSDVDVPRCPDYDAPLEPVSDGSGLWPFAYPDENRAQAQYARMLCVSNTNDSAVVHETQRFYSSAAFGHLSTVATACPPTFDDCLSPGTKDRHSCSNELARGVITCPGGVASAVFCGEDEQCSYGPFPTSAAASAEDAASTLMCAGCVDTDSGLTDPWGDNCASWYDENPMDCLHYDDDDFSSGELCCVCGGGGFL